MCGPATHGHCLASASVISRVCESFSIRVCFSLSGDARFQGGCVKGKNVKVAREGSIVAVYTAHRTALVRYANGIVGDPAHAEDVVQEAWLRLHERAQGQPPEQPVAYLYRIVRNLAIDRYRRRQREQRHIEPDGHALSLRVADDAGSPEAIATARDELRLLAEALAELPERTRIALEMRRFGGCSLQEIADHLDVSVTSVNRIIAKGIAQCRSHMRSRR